MGKIREIMISGVVCGLDGPTKVLLRDTEPELPVIVLLCSILTHFGPFPFFFLSLTH